MSPRPESKLVASRQLSEANTEKAGLLTQPKAVWAVFFASIIAFMGLGLVDPILPAIADQLNASHSEVTLLFTSYNAVMAVAMLITGVISSRLGIKWTLLSGIVIIAVFSALGGFSNGIWTLLVFEAAGDLEMHCLWQQHYLLSYPCRIVERQKQSSCMKQQSDSGFQLVPLLGGWLGAMSWRGPFSWGRHFNDHCLYWPFHPDAKINYSKCGKNSYFIIRSISCFKASFTISFWDCSSPV